MNRIGQADLEYAICRSVADFIGEMKGAAPSELDRPDRRERQAKSVDLAFQIADQRFVLEHTTIEAYDGRIRDDVVARELLRELERALADFSLPGSKLHLHLQRQVPLSRGRVKKVVPVIAGWVKEIGPNLEVGSPHAAPRHFARAYLDEAGFEVALYRWPSKKFHLETRASAPEDDALLMERLKKSAREKLPKLNLAREREEACSILVLATDDYEGMDLFSTASAARKAIGGGDLPLPDILVLFDSHHWVISTLYVDGKWVNPDELIEYEAALPRPPG